MPKTTWRSIIDLTVAVVGLLCLFGGNQAYACDKKGVGLVRLAGIRPADFFRKMNAHWYYNWNSTHPNVTTQLPFVPMVNGTYPRFQGDLQAISGNGVVPVLLGFNEPDLAKNHLGVDQAVALWPKFQGYAVRLGSPAASTFGLAWLRQFMAQAKEKHLKVDFIAVHYYGPPDANGFLERIDRLHRLYGLPVWITEFAVREKVMDANPVHYTPTQVLNFMRVVLPALERRSYIERFAWWGVGGSYPEALKSSRFFQDDGSLTEVGRYYASIEANADGNLCGAQ